MCFFVPFKWTWGLRDFKRQIDEQKIHILKSLLGLNSSAQL